MRADGRIDDEPVPVALELEVVPVRRLAAGVLRKRDARGLLSQRFARRAGGELELDHLPVGLVGVVEVVEGPVEPVLERQLAGAARLGRDPGVDGWL